MPAGPDGTTAIWVQLSHAGRQSTGKVNLSPVAPSAVPLQGIPSLAIGKPTAMAHDEIAALPARFAAAAAVCKGAGFTGVHIHAAHGYLLSSFLNPRANVRGDAYGGALAARSKVLLDVVDATRAAVGPSFPVCVKLNSADFQSGGLTEEEAVRRRVLRVLPLFETDLNLNQKLNQILNQIGTILLILLLRFQLGYRQLFVVN